MPRNHGLPVDDKTLESTKKALEANGFTVDIVDTLSEVKAAVVSMIPEGSEVFTATSATLEATGLPKELNESGKWVSVRQMFMPLWGQADKAVEMHRLGSGSDYTVGSVHAVTEGGKVLIASGSGSQLPNYVYGANHVIWVVGAQKIVKDLDEAMERLESHVYPLEDERMQAAHGVPAIISKTLVYHMDHQKRIHIILVREAGGF